MVLDNLPDDIDFFDIETLFHKELICNICNVCKKMHIEPKDAVVISPDSKVSEATELMRKSETDYVIVINKEKHATGIFTSLDIMPLIAKEGKNYCGKKIKDVMTPDPVTLTCKSTIRDVIKTIYTNKYRHVPIVKIKSKMIRGVISLSDIINYTLDFFPESTYNVSPTPNFSKEKIEGA
ncbi:MAG: CBS domain-containing protein [Candidatus Hodarchaeales archaeon]|jgi:CBS domain-containing protein